MLQLELEKPITATTYNYDQSGRLVREIISDDYSVSASTTRELFYLYDESGIIGIKYNYNGTSENYYFHRNLNGDVIAIYNSRGELAVEYVYDAFGNCQQRSVYDGPIAYYNPIRYRGYYYDVDTGFYWISSRCYSPELGRFLQPANVSNLNYSNINGLNQYIYANNNPIRIAYGDSNVGGYSNGRLITSFDISIANTTLISKYPFDNSQNDWINLEPLPIWVNTAVNVADLGFSLSLIARNAWYTLKYPGVADLMKLDGLSNIPGQYTKFVNALGLDCRKS